MPVLKFLAASLLVLLAQVTHASRKPVKVFILSGQSNMAGKGRRKFSGSPRLVIASPWANASPNPWRVWAATSCVGNSIAA